MAHVPYDVSDAYRAEVAGVRGRLASILAVHGIEPDLGLAHLELYVPLTFGRSGVTRLEREAIAVAVSAANACRYRTTRHGAALRAVSEDDLAGRLAADPDGAEVPQRLRAFLDDALLLTRRRHDVTAEPVAALKASGLSDADVHRVACVTACFAFVDRIAEGLGVELEAGRDDGAMGKVDLSAESSARMEPLRAAWRRRRPSTASSGSSSLRELIAAEVEGDPRGATCPFAPRRGIRPPEDPELAGRNSPSTRPGRSARSAAALLRWRRLTSHRETRLATRSLSPHLAWAAAVALAAVCDAAAADPPRPLDLFELGAPSFTTFSAASGAPEGVVYSLAVDRRGYVWMATPDTLARYDGQRWEPAEPPLPGVRVTSLFRDDEGTVWATGSQDWVARHDGARWSVETLPGRGVQRVLQLPARDGRMETWATTTSGAVLLRAGSRWVSADENQRLPAGEVVGMARTFELTGGERLWVATADHGLSYREPGGDWRADPRFAGEPATDLLGVRDAGGEALWISTFGRGLRRLTRRGLHTWGEEQGTLPSNRLYNLAATTTGRGGAIVWSSSRAGLVRVRGDDVQVYDRRHGLPSSVLRSIQPWRSPSGAAVLWIATENGVARTVLGDTSWQVASLMGSGANGVFGVRVEPDGQGGERLWVASAGDGLGLYEHGRWRVFGTGQGLPTANPRLLARVPDESGRQVLWTDADGHLLRVDVGAPGGPRFHEMPTPWEKRPGDAVLDVAGIRRAGRYEMWVGSRLSGLHGWVGGRWTSPSFPQASSQWRVARFVEQTDASGRPWLWASSTLGLLRYDGTRWTVLGREIGLQGTGLFSLSLLQEGGRPVLWAGSSRGVQRVDVTDPSRPVLLPSSDLPPPPHLVVYGALGDSRGRVYLFTNNGVQLLVRDAGGRFSARAFTRRDGMVHDECNLNAQAVDAHDRLWVGTLGGLSVYDPTVEPDREAKPLLLTHASVDGAEAGSGDLRVPPGTREVRVSYTLLTWQREGEARFRTQLLGWDPAPGPWTSESSRLLGGMPPGRYVLRVEAKDWAGVVSTPLEVPVTVLPAWWQTLAFRAAVGAFFLLAGPLVYVLRVRQLSRQKEALERVVSSRTRELAAANAQLAELSRVDGLTGVANRRRLDEALDEELRRAARLRMPLSLLIVDVDHFKAYNDELGHPAGDLCLRRVAESMQGLHTRAGDLVARYGGEEFAVLLPGCGRDAARAAAERVREGVARLAVPHPGSGTSPVVTVSVGGATLLPGNGGGAAELMASADQALYRAKRGGRNGVELGLAGGTAPTAGTG